MPPGGLERRSLSGSFSREASLAGQRHHGRRHRDLGGGLEGLVGGCANQLQGLSISKSCNLAAMWEACMCSGGGFLCVLSCTGTVCLQS